MATAATSRTGAGSAVDRYFETSARGSTVRRELRGGLVTFVTMAYIVTCSASPDVGADCDSAEDSEVG